MRHIQTDESSVLVLERGEELHASLEAFAVDSGLKSAWVSGLGGADKAILGFYDIATKEYVWSEFDEPLEIVSLTGNLSIVEGKPFWHVHGVFSGRNFQTVGGHVKKLVIGLTGELHITPFNTSVSRKHDETTGLKLLYEV